MPTDVPCKFFLRGNCNKGDCCTFYHGPGTTLGEPEACKFFLRGFCAAGETCRFQHGTSNDQEQLPRPWKEALPADLTYDQQGTPSYASDHPISSYDAAGSYGSYEAAASYGSLPTCSSYREASGWAGGHRSCGIDWQGEGIYDVETVEGERKNEVGTAEGGEYALAEGYADLEGEYADEEGGNAGADEAAYGDASQFADHYGQEYQDDGEFDREEWEVWATSTKFEWGGVAVCPYYQTHGSCPSWRTCGYPHGRQCPTCEKWVLHPYNEAQRVEHTEQCNARAAREVIRVVTAEQECSICLEKVMSKEAFSDRRFGLLACHHPFCLACVRGWRSHVEGGADVDSALRTCPVCRQTCHFVTPSRVWPRNEEEKAAIVEQYKQKLGSIDCKYWVAKPEGDRSCPFGTSCFYRHIGAEAMAAPRKYLTADGEVKFGNPVMLSDFLANMQL